MLISFDTGTTSPRELDALLALIENLRVADVPASRAPKAADIPALDPRPVTVEGAIIAPPPPPPLWLSRCQIPPHPVTASPSEALIAAAAEAATSVETDSTGLPWDRRIHVDSKTTKQDGTWTSKRKLDPAFVESVTAELRALMAIPVPDTAAAVDPVAAAFGSPAAPLAAAPPPPADVPVVESPVGELQPAGVVESAASSFPALMKRVTERQNAKTLSTEMTMALVQSLGLTSLGDFMKRPDLIPAFEALLP